MRNFLNSYLQKYDVYILKFHKTVNIFFFISLYSNKDTLIHHFFTYEPNWSKKYSGH